MVIPRAEKLRIIQEVCEDWQAIYGDRDDSETEAVKFSHGAKQEYSSGTSWNSLRL